MFVGLKNDILQRKEQCFYGFIINQALLDLSENNQKSFKEEADMVYTRVLKYLDNWYDFKNPFYISVQKFNLKNNNPFIQDCCEIDIAK